MSDPRLIIYKHKILRDTTDFYADKLDKLGKLSVNKPRQYLKSRGFDFRDIYSNVLGYSDGSGLLPYLLSRGYSLSQIYDSKLIRSDDDTEFFYDRLIIPLFDRDGETVLNITARNFEDKDNSPKYKHLAGNSWRMFMPICQPLYNKGTLYVVEGPLDALSMKKMGFRSVSFLGVNGFDAKYADYLYEEKRVVIIPDFEPESSVAYKANEKTMIQMHLALHKSQLFIMDNKTLLSKDAKMLKLKDMNDVLLAYKNKETAAMIIRSSNPLHIRCTQAWANYENSKMISKKLSNQNHTELDKFSIEAVLEKINADIVRTDYQNNKLYCRCFNPDHQDTHPSCVVYLDTNSFYCFACGAGSDAIGALMLAKKMDFYSALKYLQQPNT